MREAIRRGLELRREHGLRGVATEDEIDVILAAHGLTVCPDYPFAGRIRGFLLGATVYLRAGMSRRERRLVKAHELAHHLLHEAMPAAFYLRGAGGRYGLRGGRLEREANALAVALVAGAPPAGDGAALDDWFQASCEGVPADVLWEMASLIAPRWPVA